jgi:predicted nucleic acid-binding protein
MTVTSFIDTNILPYAGSKAPADQAKRQLARELLTRPDIGFSAQVLQVLRCRDRQAALADDPRRGHRRASIPRAFPVWPISRDLVLAAINAKHRFGISYWDAAIITAAKQMGCQTVYSEDMNDGQNYDSVIVVNPFAGSIPEGMA